jgi:protein TonB
MNRDVCGFSLSFFMHASILGICLYMIPALDLQPKPLVIDFSLISGISSQDIVAALPKQEKPLKPPPVMQAPPKPRQLVLPKPVIAKKILSRPAEKILPKKEEKVAIEEPLQEAVEMARPPEILASVPVVQPQVTTRLNSPIQTNSSPGAASPPSVSSQEMKQHYFKAHFVYIKKIIEKNISYPPMARRMGWQGKVLVSFIVCRDGRVENLLVVESSGHAQLDRNALETVKQVVPFPSPPVRVKLVLPVTYKIS